MAEQQDQTGTTSDESAPDAVQAQDPGSSAEPAPEVTEPAAVEGGGGRVP